MGYYFKDTDEKSKSAVWNKGYAIPGYDSREWRKDMCGKVMRYADHGKTTKYGWEIDHIRPVSQWGDRTIYRIFNRCIGLTIDLRPTSIPGTVSCRG